VHEQTFLALFYSAAWMKADRGADAPINDLQFIHDMIDFRAVDQEVADAVLGKLNNHRWYLKQEVVPFALFSRNCKMTDSLKQEMASQLLATPMPEVLVLPAAGNTNRLTKTSALVSLCFKQSHATQL